ncbi:MAG: hydrogenase nickel incorporation protein HypB [Chitinophagaceae bacterium]|nr:hydrogenase nickel incorporation protein HypB [Chitinophagaceae bacterium]
MCATCGCESNGNVMMYVPRPLPVREQLHFELEPDQVNHQYHHHVDEHRHLHQKTIVSVEQDILQENNRLAQRNRGYFKDRNILAINLVSSPGSGKTALLEKTLTDLKRKFDFNVIEGDQQTSLDADRIYATGTNVIQINTGKGCHLDAHMVLHAIDGMKLNEDAVLFIENVGNLVCPAMFDLGEKERVVIMSVTEGEDKPLKYPEMFHSSTLCIINKTDLLPYVPFNMEKAKAYARRINPQLDIIEVSCLTGEGLPDWYNWLQSKVVVREPV